VISFRLDSTINYRRDQHAKTHHIDERTDKNDFFGQESAVKLNGGQSHETAITCRQQRRLTRVLRALESMGPIPGPEFGGP